MTKKNYDFSCFKELGSLQEKVLFHLAENPNLNAQAIQQGIDYPPEQYGNINKAVKTLEKLNFAKSKEGTSQKGLEIKLYSCTENGAFYVLARNSKADIVKILEYHKSEYPIFAPFLHLYSVWGKERISKFFEDSLQFALMVNKDGSEKALPYFLMKIHLESQDMKPKHKKKVAKEILKLFPSTRKTMKEMKNNLDEILEEK